jgi:hypothetical protein
VGQFLIAAARAPLTHAQIRRHIAPASQESKFMHPNLRAKAIAVCDQKIAQKGDTVGLSFYAFFANRNDDPVALMEVAEWWIRQHQLDHFEKAVKIREMIASGK